MNLTITKNTFWCLVFTLFTIAPIQSQTHSIAREWNELILNGIRNDFARPTVHARNLFHISAAMYDAFAVYDTIASPYFLGNTHGGYTFNFDGIPAIAEADIPAARHEAISYAAYRLIMHRFQYAPQPGFFNIQQTTNQFFAEQGYDLNYISTDYASGNPADLGNYLAEQIIAFGLQDGANEINQYSNQIYEPVNSPLVTNFPGNPNMVDPNRWQPLTLDVFIDQSGNEFPFNTPPFLSPEWGEVTPFSMTSDNLTVLERDGSPWNIYHDPGHPPYLDTTAVGGLSEEYKWGFSLVSAWSSHLDPADSVRIDISPASIGNIDSYPTTIEGLRDFYDLENGGDTSLGHLVNPTTQMPYDTQMVLRADYARVLAEFWADGPDSETPPGHWFTLLNYVSDHPLFEKKYRGEGEVLSDLEWDVKTYLALGGAMHDVAITAWGIKGFYDYPRPISAIRYMADLGQSTDSLGSQYHPGGLPLIPGLIDTVQFSDPAILQGEEGANLGKIKLYAWKGPDSISNPLSDIAGVDWILAENWWPYQRPSFVTPNFAGYLSGHSTFSRAAAEILTAMTGDAYFPGGMGVFDAVENQFLVFEDGPSETITLQWATYRDASDQTSLSRIWGGIHPPVDDIPGRLIGMKIGQTALDYAETYFFIDEDQDGFFDFEDCDDLNALINPSSEEICDNIDNNCSGAIDDGITIFTYFIDADNDGFGDSALPKDTCALAAPIGYSDNDLDCDDNNELINPDATEICDNIDNNCSGVIDDGLELFTYFMDADNDGFGDAALPKDTCALAAPIGYSTNDLDCDDTNELINPDATEVCDNIDNNCSGAIDDGLELFTYFPDLDQDGYGENGNPKDTCALAVPIGYVTNDLDCDDTDATINPDAIEVCDNLDNDCNGFIDEGLVINTFYLDMDQDTYGDPNTAKDTCALVAPLGYVNNDMDCDDTDPNINPDAEEVVNNDIDEDCDGEAFMSPTTDIDGNSFALYPNPAQFYLTLEFTQVVDYQLTVYTLVGQKFFSEKMNGTRYILDLEDFENGVYLLEIYSEDTGNFAVRRFEVLQ